MATQTFFQPIHCFMEKTMKVTNIRYPEIQIDMVIEQQMMVSVYPLINQLKNQQEHSSSPRRQGFSSEFSCVDENMQSVECRLECSTDISIPEMATFEGKTRTYKEDDIIMMEQSTRGTAVKADKQGHFPSPLEFYGVDTNLSLKPTITYYDERSTDKIRQREINRYLIYFKCVEENVRDSLNTFPAQADIAKLNGLHQNLGEFVKKLQLFQIENEVFIKQIEDNEQYKQIRVCIQAITEVFDKLDESETNLLSFNKTVDKKTEHFLCSILGLEDEVADELLCISSEIRSHQTDQYWINYIFDQKEAELENIKGSKECFTKLGFNSAKANFLSNLLEEHTFSSHRTTLHWAKSHIEHTFKYNILLNPDIREFNEFNPSHTLGKEYFIPTLAEDETDIINVSAIDLPSKEARESAHLSLISEPQEKELEAVTYWFHGTDHKSALNIVRNGIDLEKGKAGADFSDGNGFYLTSSYDFARKWPLKMSKETNAIVVFKIENTEQILSERVGKSFMEGDDSWKAILRYFRNCKDSQECGPKKGKEFRRMQYVYGLMSCDGDRSKDSKWQPRPRIPPVYQLCIKDDFLAEEVFNNGSNIHKVIFFC